MSIDVVTAEIVRHRLETVAAEMCSVVERTARTQVFNETHDYSACLFDANGKMVAMAHAIAAHMASMKFSVIDLLGEVEDINEGDVFLVNDSYHGGTHLQCVVLAMPVFFQGKLVMISAVRGHQTDIGGSTPGSYCPDATEIYQEGLRIPPLKIIDRGVARNDLLQMLQANVRVRTFIEDLYAMMAANYLAEKRVHSVYAKFGLETVQTAQEYALDYAERLLRAEVSTWPEGVYVGEDYFEHDMFETRDLMVRAEVTIEDGTLKVNLEGSSPEAKGFVNSPLANTISAVFLAVAYTMPESWPVNDGFYRVVSIDAPEGSLVNPREPAPTGSCTMIPSLTVLNAVTLALSKAIPEKVSQYSPHLMLPLQVYGVDPRTGKWYLNGNRDCFYGGAGAIYGFDAWAGTPPYTCAVYCTPTEQMERSYPVLTLENEYVCDTGGSGRWRGMPGNRIVRKVYGHTASATAVLVGTKYCAKGLEGGTDGSPNLIKFRSGQADEIQVETYELDFKLEDSEVYTIESGGGGGYGSPLEREPERVLDDVIDGYITVTKAERDYGVHIDPVTNTIDWQATCDTRSQRRADSNQPDHTPR